MDIQKVGVVGAGTMGNGIAHTAAASGFEVTLIDVAEQFLDLAPRHAAGQRASDEQRKRNH